MPNRIVRADILCSERVNALTFGAECFYRRLMNVVDDYGRFRGNMTGLRSACFPLRIDTVKEKDIAKWMEECTQLGLLMLYVADGKNYLQIDNFGQTIRSKSKFPDPPDNTESANICEQMIADANNCSPSRRRIRSRKSDEPEGSTAGKQKVGDMSDEEYIAYLSTNPTYDGIDVEREAGKCLAWCEVKQLPCSRRRIINWLNRVEKPLKALPKGPVDAVGRKIEVVN